METRKVTLIASGDFCIINASDFDPSKHTPADAPAEPTPPVAPPPEEEPSEDIDDPAEAPVDVLEMPEEGIPSIASMHTGNARLYVQSITTVEALDACQVDEEQNHQGGRKTVLRAIAERRAELES